MEESYEDHVKTLFDLNSEVIFSNGMQEHARIILVEFLKRAKSSVVIFCQDLLDSVYDHKHVTSALQEALRNGVDVRIVIQNEPLAKKFIEAAAQYNADPTLGGRVILYKSNADPINEIRENFAVMDKKAYRFESNKRKHTAEASANRPKLATTLLANFELIWKYKDQNRVVVV